MQTKQTNVSDNLTSNPALNEILKAPSKHTPGPWTYAYGAVYQKQDGEREDEIANRLLLADRDNQQTMPTERDANVRLAASAPELLQALEDLFTQFEHTPENDKDEKVLSAARQAIAKAKAD